MPNDALAEEITSINAIYESGTVEVVSENASQTLVTLRIPEKSISFLVSFSNSYPDSSPHVDGTASVAEAQKGEGKVAVRTLQDIIDKVWAPEQVCLFDVIEEAATALPDSHGEDIHYGQASADVQDHEAAQEKFGISGPDYSTTSNDLALDPHSSILPPGASPPQWILSEPLVVNKSTFVAHCVPCDSKPVASAYLTHLLSTNKKVAAATHNISAWRLSDPKTGVVVQDSDDDGETAAGGRLLHLMQLMDVWNVMVVVTRWYGGVKLGPERFRCINGVAREVLLKAGHGREEKSSKKNKK